MVEIINHDLLALDCDVICHQVNCQSVMGSGIAKQIKTKYPNVYTEYLEYCKDKKPKNLLGRCQLVEIDNDKYCANLFGQLYYGYDGQVFTDYSAMLCCFMNLKDICNYFIQESKKFKTITIGIPYKIGCGLGGGDWNKVFKIISDVFNADENIIVKICKIIN